MVHRLFATWVPLCANRRMRRRRPPFEVAAGPFVKPVAESPAASTKTEQKAGGARAREATAPSKEDGASNNYKVRLFRRSQAADGSVGYDEPADHQHFFQGFELRVEAAVAS